LAADAPLLELREVVAGYGTGVDLDVIRGWTGRVWVDDEDEFAEHRVSLSYPHEIVSMAVASRDRVHAAILDEDPPFDGHHLGWQAVLDGLTPGT